MADTGLSDELITRADETYSVPFDECGAGTASMCIVRLLAAVEGVQPPDLEPLYESADPEAIDALFESYSGDADATAELTFSYAGYRITVDMVERRIAATPLD